MADEQVVKTEAPAPVAGTDDIEKNKGIAAITYILFFLPYLVAPQSKFAMYHANQSLILLIVSVVGGTVLGIIPLLGWALLPLFWIATFVLWLIGIINALNGKMKPLPLIGNYTILPQP
jgi:uncharacterized membrane protein